MFEEYGKSTEIGKLHEKLTKLFLFNNLPDEIKVEKMRSEKLKNIV